jgi:hypothetical protein
MSNNQEFLINDNDNKIKKIIQEQSDQMLTMVDVINAYDTQTKELNKTIEDLKKQNDVAKSIFNNQLLLFGLTLIVLYLFYYRLKKTNV